jgi:murein DD-endopeptidase MepM/ murein hydrolase activator NlpD
MHQGIDIAVTAGTPVHASADGRVSYAGWMSGYGNLLCITHTPRLTTCNAHLSTLRVSQRERVERGAIVALSGCTGRCFGDHVHYEIHRSPQWGPASAVDPLPYLSPNVAP